MSRKSNCKLSRRSQYIGVSKNGLNWQVLVNIGLNKHYIGTYEDEIEAAVAYDFYAFVLHPSIVITKK
jgi:hypothetical protein